MLYIPLCMMQGSLNDTLIIADANGKGNSIVEYLIQQRVYGIQECMKQKEDDKFEAGI